MCGFFDLGFCRLEGFESAALSRGVHFCLVFDLRGVVGDGSIVSGIKMMQKTTNGDRIKVREIEMKQCTTN